ncbi:MAG TPA: PilN domain-containing protein [Schlesneria sp.]
MRTAINLLPQSFRRQQIVRKRLVQWTTIISAVLLTGWGWHWYEMREDRQLTQQLETLSREHAPTQAMLKQLMEMRQQLKELEQQETVAKELDCQRNALTLLGVISDSAQKSKGRLRVTKFEISNFQGGQSSSDGTKTPGLSVSGVSLDNPAVAELLDGLQKSGVFRKVELLTLKEREDKESALRDYEVRCEF